MSDDLSILASRIQQGDHAAFKEVFLAFYEPLCKFTWGYVRSTHIAEELVQDLFLDVWEARASLDPEKNIKAFLYKSVRNKALNHQKHKKLAEEYNSRIEWVKPSPVKQKHDFKYTSEFEQSVKDAIEQLPPRAKEIYILSRKDGLTYKEIANVLDISPKTVESQMGRTLKKLRGQLSRYYSSS